MDVKELDKKYIANTYARADVVFVRGEGSHVYDEHDREYIDLGSGIAVNTFGLADRMWAAAVNEQMSKLQHMSNLYYTKPCVELAEMLCERTGMGRVFFGNSGAEANECAIKTARKWAFDKYGDTGHAGIITLRNSFHGRTITTLAATGQEQFHRYFDPFTAGFEYVDAGDAAGLRSLAAEGRHCAVMLELIQGEGGVIPLTREYVDEVRAIAEEFDLLLIVDEVQTGNGRTGSLFACQQYGFTPDIMTTAKGLAAGLPLGACLLGECTADTLTPGSHGSTFGGNPICCAAALNVLSRITDELLAEVRVKGEYIKRALRGAAGVKSVSGLGLMIGAECDKPASQVAREALERGVVVLTAHDRVRLLPALTITMEELARALEILKEVIAR